MDSSTLLFYIRLFSLATFLSGSIALFFGWRSRQTQAAWLPVIATVTAFRPFLQSMYGKGTLEVTYTLYGAPYKATFPSVSPSPIGSSLELLYDPQSPTIAVIRSLNTSNARYLYLVTAVEYTLCLCGIVYLLFFA